MTGQNEPIVSGPGSFAAGDKNGVLSPSPWESEGRGGTERERENRAPKRFLVRSRGSPAAAAAARSAAHMKLLNASAVGENQTAANTWRSQEVPPLGDGRFFFPPCSLLTLQLLIHSSSVRSLFPFYLSCRERSGPQKTDSFCSWFWVCRLS